MRNNPNKPKMWWREAHVWGGGKRGTCNFRMTIVILLLCVSKFLYVFHTKKVFLPLFSSGCICNLLKMLSGICHLQYWSFNLTEIYIRHKLFKSILEMTWQYFGRLVADSYLKKWWNTVRNTLVNILEGQCM